jgi:hypothetical protein
VEVLNRVGLICECDNCDDVPVFGQSHQLFLYIFSPRTGCDTYEDYVYKVCEENVRTSAEAHLVHSI